MISEANFGTDQLTGALAQDGADMLRAVVITQPAPLSPPTQLAEFVAPVYDLDAHLIDWRLEPHHPDKPIPAGGIAAYRQWRSTYAVERFLGERAHVRAFLDWARPRCDTRSLDLLRLPSAHVDFRTALEMRLQIEQVRKIVNDSHEHGYGLFTMPGRPSAARSLVPTDPPTLLLAMNDAKLSVDSNGLTVRRAGGEDALRVWGWTASREHVRVDTPDGEYDLGKAAAGRLLEIVGRYADEVEVHECPLSTLFAPLLVFLRDATQLAGSTGADLHIRSGWR